MSCVTSHKKIFRRFAKSENGVVFIEFAVSVFVLLIIFFATVELARYVLVLQKMQYLVNKETNIISSIDPTSVGRSYTLNPVEMFGIADTPTLNNLVQPYNFDTTGMLILTDIYNDPLNTVGNQSGTPTVEWRYCASIALESYAGTIGTVDASGNISGGRQSGQPMQNLPPSALSSDGDTYPKNTNSYSKFGLVTGSPNLSATPLNSASPAAVASFNSVPASEIIVAELYYDYTTITDNAITNAIMSVLNNQVIYLYAVSVPRYGSLAGLLNSKNMGSPPGGKNTFSNHVFPIPTSGSLVDTNCP